MEARERIPVMLALHGCVPHVPCYIRTRPAVVQEEELYPDDRLTPDQAMQRGVTFGPSTNFAPRVCQAEGRYELLWTTSPAGAA